MILALDVIPRPGRHLINFFTPVRRAVVPEQTA
jgi:hypothetical protein